MRHNRWSRCKSNVCEGRQHSPTRLQAKSEGEPSPELVRRVEDAAQQFREFVDQSRFSRNTGDTVARLIGEQGPAWFEIAINAYHEKSKLQAGTATFERAKAFDVCESIATWWMQLSPYWHTLVRWPLWAYMRACGAPLPEKWDTFTRQRKRIRARLRDALDPTSAMSLGWRRRWLGSYPLTASSMLTLKPLKLRRARLIP